MNKTYRSLLLAAFTVVLSLCSIIHVRAVTVYTLPPGGFVTALAGPYPIGGTAVATQFSPFTGATLRGLLVSQVITNDAGNPYGGLTFTYSLSLSNSSPQSLSEMTVSSFDSFLTDVSMNTNIAPGIKPSNFSRSNEGGGSGQVVRFHFLSPNLSPGDNAVLLIVQTDALSWQTTTAGLIDGSTLNVASLAPIAIPEPGAGTLLLLGLGGLGLRKLRR